MSGATKGSKQGPLYIHVINVKSENITTVMCSQSITLTCDLTKNFTTTLHTSMTRSVTSLLKSFIIKNELHGVKKNTFFLNS